MTGAVRRPLGALAWLACAATLLSSALSLSAGAASARTTRIDGPAGGSLSEPEIAVSPLDPRTALVVSKDVSSAGFQSLDAFRSSDGGVTFSGGPVVDGSYLGAPADASDPVAVFDEAGTTHFGQLVWRYPGSGFVSMLGLQSSSDGGEL